MKDDFKGWLLEHSIALAVTASFMFALIVGIAAYELSTAAIERERMEIREQRLEEGAMASCESLNETKEILTMVLEVLAEPRVDDVPGDFERRQELLAQLKPMIEQTDCVTKHGIGDAR